MYQLLNFANNIYNSHTICPENSLTDSCYDCISSHFYTTDGNEKYDCEKGLAHYILDYGPCYASSTYHFLNKSKIIEETGKKELKILSIGCGFSPDYYAFKKYITDNSLNILIDYTGIELHPEWNIFHNPELTPDKRILNLNVLEDRIPDFKIYDIIFIDKFFSSLSNPEGRSKWLHLLKHYISKLMKSDAILIFKDVNHQSRGRDLFDSTISPYFSDITRYKFNFDGAYGWHYKNINENKNVFISYPPNLAITPKNEVVKEVVFIYRNKIMEAT
nr:hypothetical protein [uncultured Treponema sp.]